MDNNIDYSNTKIFENHTKQSDTKHKPEANSKNANDSDFFIPNG